MRWMCEALDVSRGGYYAWLKRRPSAHERRDEELQGAIRRSFQSSDRTYGARRVRRDLRAWGQLCGIHRVERLMLAAGLQARRKRRRLPFDLGVRPEHAIAPNVLDREFPARHRTNAGLPTSRTSGPTRVGCTGRGTRSVLAQVVGWSMQARDDRAAGHGRLGDGDLASRQANASCCITPTRAASTPASSSSRLLDHGVACSMSRSGTVGTTRRWRASSRRSRPSGATGRSTARAIRLEPMCSITSNGSTIRGDDTRRWII